MSKNNCIDWPFPGFYDISSGIGARSIIMPDGSTYEDFHKGYDILVPVGTVGIIPVDGISLAVNNDSGHILGKFLVVESNHFRINFWHLNKIFCEKSDELKRGDRVIVSGNTGKKTTGAHCHFQMSLAGSGSGSYVDPWEFIKPEDRARLVFRNRIIERQDKGHLGNIIKSLDIGMSHLREHSLKTNDIIDEFNTIKSLLLNK